MNLYEMFKVIFQKTGKLPKDWQPFIVNKFLSFHDSTFGLACKVDKYIFWADKEMIKTIYMNLIPQTKKQPWFHYIKKPQEGKGNFEFLLLSLQKYYKWTDKELKVNTPVILSIIKDRKKLEEVMRFIGADLKEFKKQGIDILNDEGGLMKWRKE